MHFLVVKELKCHMRLVYVGFNYFDLFQTLHFPDVYKIIS